MLSACGHTVGRVSETTILHNPSCSTSRAALEKATEGAGRVVVRPYLKEQLTEAELRDLIAMLRDPVEDLVRRDPHFVELGLDDRAVADTEAVIATLLAHPRLLQRPILIRDGVAIIGRPKDRAAAFLAGADV